MGEESQQERRKECEDAQEFLHLDSRIIVIVVVIPFDICFFGGKALMLLFLA